MAGITYTSKSIPYSLSNLAGGLNSTASGISLKDSEASDLLNIDFDTFGSFKKRSGYATLNSSAANSGATCTGLHWYEKSDGTQKLFGIFGNKAYRMDDLDGTWDDITGGLTITAGNNNLFSIVTTEDTVVFTNNTDPPFTATDSGNAAAATVPTGLTDAKFVAFWNNYTFYANVTVSGALHGSRFYWSNLKDITTWTATDYIDVALQDGSNITGIQPLGDYLIIFKEYSIYIVIFTGDSDVPFLVKKTQSSIGAISGYSIQEINNGLVFLSIDGIYFFDGRTSKKLSDRINATLSALGTNRFQYAISTYQSSKNRYYLTLTTSGNATHNRIITWDSFNNAFSVYSGHASNALTIVNTSGAERIYFGDYSGYAYRMDYGTADNPAGVKTAISSYFKTKFFNFENLYDEQGVPHVTVFYRISDSTIQFGYSYDFEDANDVTESISFATSSAVYGSAVYGTDTYAASGGAVIRRDIDGRGRTVRFTFTNNTVDETMQIDGMGFFKHLESAI